MKAGQVGPVVLQAFGLTKKYPGVLALDRVDFDLRAGEVHVLLGENGAGKSTLIKILSGVFPPDEGRLKFLGAPVSLRDPRHALSLGISTIFQDRNLVPDLTVAENIVLGREPLRGRWLRTLDDRAASRTARDLLAPLGLTVEPSTIVRTLGVAEQQMVEIAKALSIQAKCVIMDEPTAALSEEEVDRLFRTVRRLRDQGVGVIYISHRLHEVALIADRVTVLRDGRKVAELDGSDISPRRMVQMMVGRDVQDQYPKIVAKKGPPRLTLRGVSAPGAFEEIDLDLHAGEVVGLAGVLGSGCRELLWAIFGAYPYARGVLRADGVPLQHPSPARAIRWGFGLLPEDRKRHGLILPFSIRENVSLPSLERFSPGGWIQRERERTAVDEVVRKLAVLPPTIETAVQTMSGGNQQKVVLAKSMMSDAKVFLFDEPTRGVDVGAKVEVYTLMNRLTERGAGILLVSSDLRELLGMSDRILVMRRGRIVGAFDRGEATQENVLALAAGAEPAARSGG